MYMSGIGNVIDEPIIIFRNSATGPQIRLAKAVAGLTASYIMQITTDGTTWSNIGSSFTLTNATRYDLDIHVKFSAGAGVVEVYRDGTSVVSFSGAVVSQSNQCDQHDLLAETSQFKNHSEQFVDDVSTIGNVVINTFPTGDFSNTNWASSYLGVDEPIVFVNSTDNPFFDYASTGTVNAQVVYDKLPLPTTPAYATREIRGVRFEATARVFSDGAVTALQAALVSGPSTVNSGSLGFTLDVLATKQITYVVSPFTTVAWTGVEVDALKIGVKAV
jgi:hypothetical protein